MKGHVLSPRGRFEPLKDDHPAVGQICPLCGGLLRVGDVPALVEIGPDDEENTAKAAAGQAHNVACEITHETCAYRGA